MQPESQVRTERSEQASGDVQFHQFSVSVPGTGQCVIVSLGYRRATDFDHANQPGQDYAIVRAGAGFVAGVVADGVSQSFYGHLAARFLAEKLLQSLWERRRNLPSAGDLSRELRAFECGFKTEIDSYALPTHLQPLQRDALEQTRERAGSQAVFAGFVLDVQARRLRLFEVGDALAVVHCTSGETNSSHCKIIQANQRGRWSSAGNSELLLEEIDEQDVKGVIVKSDGARNWGESLGARRLGQTAFFEVAPDFANYDDVSFVAAMFQDGDASTTPVVDEASREVTPRVATVQAYQRVPPVPHVEDESHSGSRPSPRRGEWKMLAAGVAAGSLFSASAFAGLVYGGVFGLRPRAATAVGALSSVKPEAKCGYQLQPLNKNFEASGAPEQQLQIKTAPECEWTAVSQQDWIKLTKEVTGKGDGVLSYIVEPNHESAREGLIKVEVASFQVKQRAASQDAEEPSAGQAPTQNGSTSTSEKGVRR